MIEYKSEFIELVEECHSAYIGYGNPNSKILIIGKEAAIEPGSEQHIREIVKNSEQWKHNIDNQIQPNDIKPGAFNPLYPYQDGPFKKSATSSTWYYYQKLFNLIKKKDTGKIDFLGKCFITEFNENSAKKSNDNSRKVIEESISKRKELFKKTYFQEFPIIIVACAHYVKDYNIDLQDIFGVEWKQPTIDDKILPTIGKQKWINVHYQKEGGSPKLLIHTNQFSIVSDVLLIEIARICQEFIYLHNIIL